MPPAAAGEPRSDLVEDVSMFRKALSVLLVGVSLAACQPPDSTVTDDQRTALTAEVNQTLADLFTAMNGRDGEAVLSFYRDDPDLIYIGLIQPIVAKETFSRVVGQWYRRNPGVSFEHQVMHVQILSPTVAATFTVGSSSERPSIAWTHVLVRGEDGQWKIVHEHEAWPQGEAPEMGTHPGM
jgi:uncharacterized protein (TIGR02246 family)